MAVGSGSGAAVAVGSGAGAAVAVGSGIDVAVAVDTGVGVAVAVGSGMGVAVAVGVGLAVAVAVRAAVTVARIAYSTVASISGVSAAGETSTPSGVVVRLSVAGVVMGLGGEGTGEIVGTVEVSFWVHAEMRRGITVMSRNDFPRI